MEKSDLFPIKVCKRPGENIRKRIYDLKIKYVSVKGKKATVKLYCQYPDGTEHFKQRCRKCERILLLPPRNEQ